MFVGVVYAAAIWLARRANAAIPVRIAIFFYALVFVFFYLPLTQDYVNLPVDFLKTLPPWAHLLRDHRASNLYMNDIVLQIVPWSQQVRDAWRSLHVPLVTSACMLPAVLYATDLLAERVTYKRFVTAAVVWAVLLFGGHPETAAHTFFIAVLYALWIGLVERKTQNAERRTQNVLNSSFFALRSAFIVPRSTYRFFVAFS